MAGRDRGPIDDDLAAFVQKGVSAMLGTTDDTSFPDVTRVNGVAALDDRRLRILIATDAATARANAVPGARVAVLVTELVTYRSIQFKGAVLVVEAQRTAGDLALQDHHIASFVDAAPEVGIDPAKVPQFFVTDVVPLVVEVEELYDQTPGPGAGRRIGAGR